MVIKMTRTRPERLPRIVKPYTVPLLVAQQPVHDGERPLVQLRVEVLAQVALQKLDNQVWKWGKIQRRLASG